MLRTQFWRKRSSSPSHTLGDWLPLAGKSELYTCSCGSALVKLGSQVAVQSFSQISFSVGVSSSCGSTDRAAWKTEPGRRDQPCHGIHTD